MRRGVLLKMRRGVLLFKKEHFKKIKCSKGA